MAALLPDFQREMHLGNGAVVTVSQVTLMSASDTVQLVRGANTTDNASCNQIRDAGEAAVTVTFDSSTGIATLAGGTAGNQVTLTSIHRFINSGLEGA